MHLGLLRLRQLHSKHDSLNYDLFDLCDLCDLDDCMICGAVQLVRAIMKISENRGSDLVFCTENQIAATTSVNLLATCKYTMWLSYSNSTSTPL